MNILQTFKKNIVNLPGWRTNRKIIVIESDDWGMIRMASKEAYNWFLENGYKVDQSPVDRNDALETNDDLELLFGVLSKVKDKYGCNPVITANNIVANPDFEKIKAAEFSEYFYEPFTQTLDRYSGRDRVFELYKEGINQRLFYPQFHGREHINVNQWMKQLNSNNKKVLDAFKHNMPTVYKSVYTNCRNENLDAFGKVESDGWAEKEEVIQTGLDLFERIWGYRSLSFIAPCYIWPTEIEKILYQNGIKYMQGTHVQREPTFNSNIKKKYHYQGQTNKFGQRYLVRNVVFEPSLDPSEDSVSRALKEISCAFRHKKPAIICTHRFNFMGSIHSENRVKTLEKLYTLLTKLKKQWPEVEFMTTPELGKCMENDTMIFAKQKEN